MSDEKNTSVTAYGTGLRRYILEVVRSGDDAVIAIYAAAGRKTVIKLLLRGEERRKLAKLLGGG